ncbi:hypothetical protein DPV78_012418 [Talaromyces pinophilus]|nr:hypothetical protein DPV78_012418 [Talaromyces pinophilus]
MANPNADSPNSNPETMTYLILGFDTTEIGPDGEELVLATDRTTDDSGQSPDQPFQIPLGTYFLTLRLAYERPIQVTNSEGQREDHFEKTMWHIETSSVVKAPDRSTRPILLICKPRDSIGEQLTYDVASTKFDRVYLGNIVFKNRGDYELMLVGDVHLCFWDDDGAMHEPLTRNLKYYIRVV